MLITEKVVNDLLNNGISTIDHICDDTLLQLLHAEITDINRKDDLRNAKIGRFKNNRLHQKIRRDKIKWLTGKTPTQQAFLEILESLRVVLNEHLMLGLFNTEAHYAVYRQGDFYKKHFDSFKGGKNRIISLVLYLNKNWQEGDGGLLNIYQNIDDETPISHICPKWGNAVLFLSEDIPHEVTTSNTTRYSIAAWFRVRAIL